MNSQMYDVNTPCSSNAGASRVRESKLLQLLNDGDFAAVPVHLETWQKRTCSRCMLDRVCVCVCVCVCVRL